MLVLDISLCKSSQYVSAYEKWDPLTMCLITLTMEAEGRPPDVIPWSHSTLWGYLFPRYINFTEYSNLLIFSYKSLKWKSSHY